MGCGASRVAANPSKPLVAAHFHGRARLAALVLGPAGKRTTAGADIRLLSARKLVAYIDGGGRLAIRQTLEAAGKDIFLDAATVRGLLPELETKARSRSSASTRTPRATPPSKRCRTRSRTASERAGFGNFRKRKSWGGPKWNGKPVP